MTENEMREAVVQALEGGGMPRSTARRWVPDLMPVVRRIAAEELRAAAELVDWNESAMETIRAHADTLAPEPPR